MIVLLSLVAVAITACTGSSGDSPSSSSAATTSSGSTFPTITPVGGNGSKATLRVESWGYTSDGLLSVMVRNTGPGTVIYARGTIRAKDSDGDLVAAVTAPAGTFLGTRCCTITGLVPGQSYGLYAKVGRGVERVDSVDVTYSSVRTAATPTVSPVVAATGAALTIDNDGAAVTVHIKTAPDAEPYFTIQAQLHRPNGDFMGIVSSGFYCISPASTRIVTLGFFHPVPTGATVDSVRTFALDASTAKLERLKSCTTG